MTARKQPKKAKTKAAARKVPLPTGQDYADIFREVASELREFYELFGRPRTGKDGLEATFYTTGAHAAEITRRLETQPLTFDDDEREALHDCAEQIRLHVPRSSKDVAWALAILAPKEPLASARDIKEMADRIVDAITSIGAVK